MLSANDSNVLSTSLVLRLAVVKSQAVHLYTLINKLAMWYGLSIAATFFRLRRRFLGSTILLSHLDTLIIGLIRKVGLLPVARPFALYIIPFSARFSYFIILIILK